MYISQIELFGFKSFAQRTRIALKPGTTVVVGPNGSGKTNILDAMRWVLGEQKVSILRSEKMENVIFNGSVNRKPMGMSEVTLTIQNNRNLLPADYSELQVTRRLYRSGESEYLINRSVCRLKDVQDLFMDTGLGPDSYAVIELKMVEDLLSDKTEVRRQLFEEAAGITRFKNRRRSAMNKLESTRQDMQRLEDILTEVSRNVNSLKRQMGKARRYQRLQDELVELDQQLLVFEELQIQQEVTPLREQYDTHHAQVQGLEDDLQALHLNITKQEGLLSSRNGELVTRRTELDGHRQVYRQRENEHIAHREQLKAMQEQEQRLRSEAHSLNNRMEESGERLELLNREITESEEALQQVRADYTQEDTRFQQLDNDYQRVRQENDRTRQEVMSLVNSLAQLDAELTSSRHDRDNLEVRLEDLDEEIRLATMDVKLTEKKKSETRDNLTQWRHTYEQGVETSNQATADLQQLTTDLRTREDQLLERQLEYRNLTSRVDFLEKLIVSHEGLPGGVKALLESGVPGLKGPLGNLISADDDLMRAVEAVLGPAFHYLVADNASVIEAARTILREKGLGYVTLMNRSLLAAETANEVPRDSIIHRIKSAPEDRDLFVHLFGPVRFIDENDLPDSPEQGPCVNRAGEVLWQSGVRRVGRSDSDVPIIGAGVQLQDFQQALEPLTEQITNDEKQVAELQQRLETSRQGVATLEQQRQELLEQIRSAEQNLLHYQETTLRSEKALQHFQQEQVARTKTSRGLEEKLNELEQKRSLLDQDRLKLEAAGQTSREDLEAREREVSHLREAVHRKHLQLVELEGETSSLRRDRENLNRFMEESRTRVAGLTTEADGLQARSAELDEKLRQADLELIRDQEQLRAQESALDELNLAVDVIRNGLKELQKNERDLRDQRDELQQQIHKAEIRLNEYRVRLEDRMTAFQETYGMLPSAETKSKWTDEFDAERIPELQAGVQKVRYSLKTLGPVNLEALGDYDEASERLEFLQKQKTDLAESETMLVETISKINRVARERFEEVFKKVQVNFDYLFRKLFNDGKARLTLEEGDPLESNVSIFAAPSGKKIQSLNLMSGGEKTLTAIALLFSIYMVKPSPFCILDEVDAPLDDANITRYNTLIQEFARNTQFLMITHNKRTMEFANSMYGVTMAEEGVSSIVSVQFDEQLENV